MATNMGIMTAKMTRSSKKVSEEETLYHLCLVLARQIACIHMRGPEKCFTMASPNVVGLELGAQLGKA